MLTKHFKLDSELGPAYTGGKFVLAKDGFAFAQNNVQISLVETSSGKVVGKVAQENEDIINFALSPNCKLLAATFKNHLVRVYSLGDLHAKDWKPENEVVSFKTANMLGLELCFDPSSRYVAIATSDS